VIALAEPAAGGGGEAQLLRRLDALCHDVHAEAGAQCRDRTHDRGADVVARHAAQERAVDLMSESQNPGSSVQRWTWNPVHSVICALMNVIAPSSSAR